MADSSDMMRAIQVRETGGGDVLRWTDVEVPRPGPTDLLIEVEAVGVNFIEVYQREGLYPVPMPYIPGAEAGGVVTAVGSEVTGFAVGDRVVSQSVRGAYAPQALVAADRAVRIPDGVETRIAVAAWLQGLTAHYLATTTFPLSAGHRCLVHAAAGGVGLLLVQIARMRGADVYGTASTEAKRALAMAAGATEMIDYTTTSFTEVVRSRTDGRGLDVVYDSVGRTTVDGSLDSLAPRGMLVLFGQSSGAVPSLDPLVLSRKGSLFLTRPTLAHYVATRDELDSRADDLFRWIAAGKLDVRIGAEYPLEQAAEAHRALEGRETTGKVLLAP